MKQHIVLFLVTTFFLSVTQDASARRAPHMKLDIERDKSSHFSAIRGSAIFSADSLFSRYDTVRNRFFDIQNNEPPWCEILTTQGVDQNWDCYWKIILYSKDDSVVSNAFKISTSTPKLKLEIGNNKLVVSEEIKSKYFDDSLLSLFLLLINLKILGMLLFSIWDNFSVKKLIQIILLNLCSVTIYTFLFSGFLDEAWMFVIVLLLLFAVMLYLSGRAFSIKEFFLLASIPLLIGLMFCYSDEMVFTKTIWCFLSVAIWTTITYSEYVVLKRHILPTKRDTFVLICNSLASTLALIITFVYGIMMAFAAD